MLAVVSVLRSGGIYDHSWVQKLARGVARNLALAHQFICVSDLSVGGDGIVHIPLPHNWPGWWAKIALFKPGLIPTPAIYLDLDNVVVGDLAPLVACPHDFAMLRNFNHPDAASSCVMWFGRSPPRKVYDKFAKDPAGWIAYHESRRKGPYLGDQAFISDCFDGVPLMDMPKDMVVSYRKNVQPIGRLPDGARMVAFGGSFKPNNTRAGWLTKAWT